MDAAVGAGAAGGPVLPVPAMIQSPDQIAVGDDDHEVLVGDDSVENSGFTELETEELLKTALRLLEYALPFGGNRLNRQAFWLDISRSMKDQKNMSKTARSCELRYKGVLTYYRRERGTLKGQNYRFADILEKIIPVDDTLQPTKTSTSKKTTKDRKRSSSTGAGPSGAGEMLELLRAWRAELESRDKEWRAELHSRDKAWRAELESRDNAWRAQQESRDNAWRAQQEAILAELRSLRQVTSSGFAPSPDTTIYDPLFAGDSPRIPPYI